MAPAWGFYPHPSGKKLRGLDITAGSVKLDVKASLRKLGLRARVEAAVTAAEHGLGKIRRKPGTATGA